MLRKSLFAMAAILLIALLVNAQVPQLINYQGVLINPSTGQPVADNTYSIIFSIYDVASGGSAIWTETQSVETKNGVYNVLLGSVTALQPSLLDSPEKYLGIKVGSDPEMTPRRRIVSVAYAIICENAHHLGSKSAMAFADSSHQHDDRYYTKTELDTSDGNPPNQGSNRVSWDNLTEMPAGFADGVDNVNGVSGNTLDQAYDQGGAGAGRSITADAGEVHIGGPDGLIVEGNVGIGTEPPTEKLHVGGNIKTEKSVLAPNGIGTFQGLEVSDYAVVNGLVAIGTTATDSGQLHVTANGIYAGYFLSDYTQVMHAEYTGTNNYDAIAIYGKSKPADYYGYGGYFVGGHAGVYGEVNPGAPSPTDKVYWGVRGRVVGGNGEASGVDGYAAATYVNYGVSGLAEGGFDNRGVRGTARGTGKNYGVWGYAYNGTENWAGYFWGNVRVTGQINPAMSSFKIDHPTDPANKYLSHSSVESPDMMNVYNGDIFLDAKGEGWVELPEWFEALNKDFRYQLTCIGGFAPIYIANKISNNRFKIAGGTPGLEVSWQVTGIRKDPYAEQNRIQVEQMKHADEQGKYLNPEAYGLPENMGIGYEERHRIDEEYSKAKEKR